MVDVPGASNSSALAAAICVAAVVAFAVVAAGMLCAKRRTTPPRQKFELHDEPKEAKPMKMLDNPLSTVRIVNGKPSGRAQAKT